jgi:type IV pilus assembly protein PilW
MFVFSLMLIFVYSTYTGLLFNFKDLTKQTETQMQTMPGLNILRLDIEHAGYGIASDEPNTPIDWNNSIKTLTIRSTINSTNDKTLGWELVNCDSSGNMQILASDNNTVINNNTNVVWLDAKDNDKFISNGTANACPKNDAVLLGFPYDNTVNNGCSIQFCNVVKYGLSTTQQSISTCNPNTHNLLRKVGNSNGLPVLNCVADFKVVLDNATDPHLVNVYIALQEGQKKDTYKFGSQTLSEDGVTLNLPPDFVHYKWKLIKLSIKPMGIDRSLP